MAATADELSRKKFLQASEKSFSSGRLPVKITQEILEKWGLKSVVLHQYQIKGVQWLAERLATGHGCLLGDEMGLGKTLQVIW